MSSHGFHCFQRHLQIMCNFQNPGPGMWQLLLTLLLWLTPQIHIQTAAMVPNMGI